MDNYFLFFSPFLLVFIEEIVLFKKTMEDLKHATENYHVGSSEFTQGVKEIQDVTSCRLAYEGEMTVY